ncbi:MAG: hypothetical protein NZ518_07565, partial [Dehalococcoidia bacterium]|nr:hypothetical protein [Dehalococcoidia bacterium]
AYTVFVQALAADGRVIWQRDLPPGDGAAPTTSWLVGDVVVDRPAVPWPPAERERRLIVGLYDPISGARLRLPDGADYVDITALATQDR